MVERSEETLTQAKKAQKEFQEKFQEWIQYQNKEGWDAISNLSEDSGGEMSPEEKIDTLAPEQQFDRIEKKFIGKKSRHQLTRRQRRQKRMGEEEKHQKMTPPRTTKTIPK